MYTIKRIRLCTPKNLIIILNSFFYCRYFCINVLSQWRAYADDGHGVAIGFELGILPHFDLTMRQYGENLTTSVMIDEVSYSCIDDEIEFMKKILSACLINYEKLENESTVLSQGINALSRLSIYTKGKGFEEEQEVRLVFFPCYRDNNCITAHNILRELGRRKHLLESGVYECPSCKLDALIELSGSRWSCLICGFGVEDSTFCSECGCNLPNSERIYQVATSYLNADDFKFLCPSCAQKLRGSELYIDYEIG